MAHLLSRYSGAWPMIGVGDQQGVQVPARHSDISRCVQGQSAQEQRQRDYTEERKNRLRQQQFALWGKENPPKKTGKALKRDKGQTPVRRFCKEVGHPLRSCPKRPKDRMASQLDKDQAREIAMKMLGIKEGASSRRVCQAQGTAIRTNEDHEVKGTPGPRQPGPV